MTGNRVESATRKGKPQFSTVKVRPSDRNTLYLDGSSCRLITAHASSLACYVYSPQRQSYGNPQQKCNLRLLPSGFPGMSYPLGTAHITLFVFLGLWLVLIAFQSRTSFPLRSAVLSPPYPVVTMSFGIQITTAGHSWHVQDGCFNERPVVHFLNHTSRGGAGLSHLPLWGWPIQKGALSQRK